MTPINVFYLVRPAHADWTPDERRPLSQRGRDDAERVAEVLAHLPVDAIYSSPYRRARETIEPLAARLGLPIETAPELRERLLGGEVDASSFLAAIERTWREPDCALPGGESNAAAGARAQALMERLLERHPGQRLVLATHGNLLSLLLKAYDPTIDFEFWRALTMPDVFRLRLDPGGPSIKRLWCWREFGCSV